MLTINRIDSIIHETFWNFRLIPNDPSIFEHLTHSDGGFCGKREYLLVTFSEKRFWPSHCRIALNWLSAFVFGVKICWISLIPTMKFFDFSIDVPKIIESISDEHSNYFVLIKSNHYIERNLLLNSGAALFHCSKCQMCRSAVFD